MSAQFLQQVARLAVGQGDVLHVQYRIAQAGGEHRVADVMHVQEAADVRGLVHLGPGRAQLLERIRAQGGEHQEAAGLEHPGALGKQCRQVVDPLEAQVRMQDVDAVVGQRQRGRLGRHAQERPQPAAVMARRLEHGHRGVDGDDFRLRIALLQRRRAAAGAGADIDHALRRLQVEAEAVEQQLLDLALEHVVLLECGCGAPRAPAHLAQVEQELAHAAGFRAAPVARRSPVGARRGP